MKKISLWSFPLLLSRFKHGTARPARFAALTLMGSLGILAGTSARAGSANWTDYSVVSIGNLSTSADITGNAYVGGNVTGNSFTLGQDLPNVSSSAYSMTVAGNLNFSNQINVEHGYSVLYAGTKQSGNFNFNAGSNNYKGQLDHSATSLATTTSALSSQIHSAATDFYGMQTNGTITGPAQPNGQPAGPLVFTYSGPTNGIAVFSVTASLLMDSHVQQLKLVLDHLASSVVINVDMSAAGNGGTDYRNNFSVPNTFGWQGAFDDAHASKILWNFMGATGTLQTNNQFYGSILAPDANFTNHSPVNGSIFVASYSGQGEIHYKNGGVVVKYNGYDPTAVPEPTSLALFGLGTLVVGFYARRSRRTSKSHGA